MQAKLLVLAAAGLIAMGTGAATLVGCSNGTSSYHPPASQLKEGVNLLDISNPAWGSNAAFVANGRVVYVETRVGPQKPDVYRQSWPDDPPNEMDMRFVDQNGYTFYVMRGGDSLVDPTWAAEMTKTAAANRLVASADRNLDWQIAQQGAKAVAAALPATFKDHVFHLTAFGEQLPPAEDPVMQAKAERIMSTPLPTGQTPKDQVAYGNFSYASNYSWLETDKYSGSTGCALWVCAASHSATNMWDAEWNGSSYTWVLAVVANNHGRAPSQLHYDCYSNGGWFNPGTTVSGSTAGSNTGNSDGQGGCQTAYSWDSGGYDHLCNDDAAYELWQAKTGSMATGQGYNGAGLGNGDQIGFQWYGSSHCDGSFCGSSPSWFACNCSSFNGCSGDWNTPNCP